MKIIKKLILSLLLFSIITNYLYDENKPFWLPKKLTFNNSKPPFIKINQKECRENIIRISANANTTIPLDVNNKCIKKLYNVSDCDNNDLCTFCFERKSIESDRTFPKGSFDYNLNIIENYSNININSTNDSKVLIKNKHKSNLQINTEDNIIKKPYKNLFCKVLENCLLFCCFCCVKRRVVKFDSQN